MNWEGGRNEYYRSQSKAESGVICVLCGVLMLTLAVILAVGNLLGVIG